MSYLVLGLFPNQMEADNVLTKLENAGYNNYTMSHSHQEFHKNVAVDKKNGFWNWLLFYNNLVDEPDTIYTNLEQNTVTVYLNTESDTTIVMNILENHGATNVEVKNVDYLSADFSTYSQEYLISENIKAKIISKAKNNLFFTNDRKPHHIHAKRMADEIDGAGDRVS